MARGFFDILSEKNHLAKDQGDGSDGFYKLGFLVSILIVSTSSTRSAPTGLTVRMTSPGFSVITFER